MKLLLSCVTLLFGFNAYAETIHCSFTEPFMTISYNSDNNRIKIKSIDTGTTEIKGSMRFQKNGVLKISLEGLSQTLEINTNKEGSDRMSNFIYPFEGKMNDDLYGGCETDSLKKTLSPR